MMTVSTPAGAVAALLADLKGSPDGTPGFRKLPEDFLANVAAGTRDENQ
jgi:hypothetical protein